MFARMHFPNQIINLIHACIITPTFLVLINDVLRGYIPSARGIRQADPLSPYLFCIAMKYMFLQLESAIKNKQITFI